MLFRSNIKELIGLNLVADGADDIVVGMLGGCAGTNYGENNSLMAITRNYSTSVLMTAGAMAIVFGFFGKLVALVNQGYSVEQAAQVLESRQMARGGIASLGHYSDGGRFLKGPGDGMSDDIPATIAGKQPARLADGEFVIPADVVSHLGNGSTDAGAKRLHEMMNKVRKARTGNPKQGKQINANKYMPT